MPEHQEPGAFESRGTDVILDVAFDAGLLFLVLANVGDRPALKVSCRFERRFSGLGGKVEMSALPLFRNVEFLASGREIRTLLDSSAAYFSRREPKRLAVTVAWRDEAGAQHERRIVHDLGIYRGVAYVVPADERER
ncbi:MAG: hypothetical protein KY396_02715 [Actinobacteria bacterium]|nr:hypothetical protein [Actinomycetota bacterium]